MIEGPIKKKRTVLLLGAGAARTWEGPSTDDVTNLILGTYKYDELRNTDPKVVNLIRDFFLRKFPQNTVKNDIVINFEDILNVVEELILYYHQNEKEDKSILSHFFDLKSDFKKELEEVLKEKENIVKELEDLWVEIFHSITSLVHKYSRHSSDDYSKIIPNKGELNICEYNKRIYLIELFNSWADKIGMDKSILRSYTLNYDRLYKVLIENFLGKEDQVFEGFRQYNDCPDIKAILFERNRACHYNLHGSIYWCLLNRGEQDGLNNPVFVLNKTPFLLNREESYKNDIEVGRPFIISNIIAGYKKSQRSFSSPFKQMHSSFELDCMDGDNMYIVGYSFSDKHVNAGIESAIIQNDKLIIHIIDPSFKNKEFNKNLKKLLTEDFPELFNFLKVTLNQIDLRPHEKKYLNGKLIIYPLTFEEYLEHENGIL